MAARILAAAVQEDAEGIGLPALRLHVPAQGHDAVDVARLRPYLPGRGVPLQAVAKRSVGFRGNGERPLEGLEVLPARRERREEIHVCRRGGAIRAGAPRSVNELIARGVEPERGEERGDLGPPVLPRAAAALLGAERLQDLLGEEGLRALVAHGERGQEGRLVCVQEHAPRKRRRHGRGLGLHGRRGVDADAAFAQDLRKGRREIKGRVGHGHVADPRPVPAHASRRHDRVAAGLAAHSDPRPLRGGDDVRDEVQEGRPERVEAEQRRASGPKASRGAHEHDVVVVGQRRNGRLVPPLLLLAGPIGMRLDVVEKRHVQKQPVPDTAEALFRE